jgi:DNA-binding transcriptional MerR regulator
MEHEMPDVPSVVPPSADRILFTMGQMSKSCGLTQRALRLYESRGLIKPCRLGAHRYYDAEDKRRISIIVNAKNMGFSLQQIEDILAETHAVSAEMSLSNETITSQLKVLECEYARINAAIFQLRGLLNEARRPDHADDSAQGGRTGVRSAVG